MKTITLTFLALAFFVTSCNSGENSPQQRYSSEVKTELMTLRLDTLATGLENPWGMAFLPDGKILITERPGRLRILANGQLLSGSVAGVPEVVASGQGGLLDIVLHPDFNNNQFIYFTYSAKTGRETSTGLARGVWKNNALTDVRVLFKASPTSSAGHHFGSRIVFDRQGYVFFSVGERGVKEDAQLLNKHSGKIIRLNEDGTIPADNPFVGVSGALPEIWSYGHRNPQGLIIDDNGVIWEHEHGPQGGDELNVIEKGKNYGWPKATYGIDYDGSVISKDTALPGITGPFYYWTPSIAPCGMTMVKGDAFKRWEGNILVGALSHQHLQRLVIQDGKVVKTEKILDGFARFRDVRVGPDGMIYALTENPGMLIRLQPL